jgi:nitrogen regulatory protein PII
VTFPLEEWEALQSDEMTEDHREEKEETELSLSRQEFKIKCLVNCIDLAEDLICAHLQTGRISQSDIYINLLHQLHYFKRGEGEETSDLIHVCEHMAGLIAGEAETSKE